MMVPAVTEVWRPHPAHSNVQALVSSCQALLLLTFTRRAALEMTRRAQQILGASQRGRAAGGAEAALLAWSGSFHSIGNRLLRRHAATLSLDPTFTVLDRANSADLMDLVRSDLGLARTTLPVPKEGHVFGDLFLQRQCRLSARGDAGRLLPLVRRVGSRAETPLWARIAPLTGLSNHGLSRLTLDWSTRLTAAILAKYASEATMRAAIFRNGDFIVDHIKDPTPSEGQVLVKSLCCGICGSDHTRLSIPWSSSIAPAGRAIVGPWIRAAGFLFGTQIRHSESRDERPMPETHQRVPYQGACRSACCPDRFAAAHPLSPAPRLIRVPAPCCLTLI